MSLSDGWKMITWLTAKIKYYFNTTQDAMCTKIKIYIYIYIKTNKKLNQPGRA